MCDQLFFYGIDKEYIPISDAHIRNKRHSRIKVPDSVLYKISSKPGKKYKLDIDFPEAVEIKNASNKKGEKCSTSSFFPDHGWTDNNFELYRFFRRIAKPRKLVPKTNYIYKDDVEKLQTNYARFDEKTLAELLNEAAFFGSIKCFKHLMINSVAPSQHTLELAC